MESCYSNRSRRDEYNRQSISSLQSISSFVINLRRKSASSLFHSWKFAIGGYRMSINISLRSNCCQQFADGPENDPGARTVYVISSISASLWRRTIYLFAGLPLRNDLLISIGYHLQSFGSDCPLANNKWFCFIGNFLIFRLFRRNKSNQLWFCSELPEIPVWNIVSVRKHPERDWSQMKNENHVFCMVCVINEHLRWFTSMSSPSSSKFVSISWKFYVRANWALNFSQMLAMNLRLIWSQASGLTWQ